MFARHLTHDGHSRRFSIAPAADRGWEVRDEHDSQVLRHVCYDDWHRVERARMEFLFQTAQLERSGWRLQV